MTKKKQRPPRPPDCPTFRRMWENRVPRAEIARIFGASVVAVSEAARLYGFPPRESSRLRLRGPMPERRPDPDPAWLSDVPEPEPDNAEEVVARVRGVGPRWTQAQLVAVFRSGGRYAELARLARDWGVGLRVVQALWHRVRVAA